MGMFVKQGSTWKPLTNLFVKQGTVWKVVKYAYVKIGSVWTLFWPKAGPYTTTAPYISLDSAGNNQPSGYTLNTGSTVYLQKGTWNRNGYTISSYSYTFGTSSNSTPGTGGTTTYDSGSLINYAQETLTSSIYDGLYVVGTITANTTTTGVTGSDSTDSNNYRYFVCRKYPPTEASGYSPAISSSPTTTETVVSGGDLAVRGANSFTYTNYWNGTSDYLPDSTRSFIVWYVSPNYYTSASAIVLGATQLTSSTAQINTPYPSNNGTIYSTSSTLIPNTISSGSYYYAVEYQYNSNTDFATTGPTIKFAYVGPINNSPTPTTYPTLTATTPSGYIGNQNSFTVGATVTGNTGYWSPTPNGSYPIISSFKYSTSSNISLSNQGSWNVVTSPGVEGGFQSSYQGQNTSFTLGGLVTSSTGSAGKYLEYFVTAENGNGANSSSDFATNAQLIYPTPNAQSIVLMTWTSDNAANVTWSSLYTSDHYQLTYSTSSTTSSGTWTPIGSVQYTSGSAIAYSGLPSGTYYYSVISYNADGVGIYGPVFSYNSTPPPDAPTFTYDYGSQNLYNGTITATANKSTSISATVYRSGSSSWGTTITYDTAYSSGTNKLYYSIPTSGYYYLYVTATNSYGSTSAYSIINNSTIFYAGIPIGTAYQSVSASTTALEIDLSWTPATWQTYSPYTGDNVTYRNNNASYEVYRSTSSSTPANSVTPTYTGLTGSSYADTLSLSSSTTYYYWIRGRNTETYSGWQSMGNATTYTPPSPQPFTTISGTKAYPTGATQSYSEPTQNRTLTTSWNASTNATYYEVQYEGSNDNSTWTVLQSLAGAPYLTTTSNTYAAAYYRYYRYTVRARDAARTLSTAAYSDYGSSGSLVYYYITGSNPSTPSINSVTPGTGSSYNSALVNYSFPSNPGSNTIDWNYWSLDNATWNQVYATSFTISSLSASTGYYVYMRSMNYDMLYSGSTYQYFVTNAAPVYYTVTWNANGGTVSPASSTQSTVGGSVTAPTPTLSGYSFNGWYNAASGGSLIVNGGGSYTPSSNTTLYAQWTYIHVYPTISSTLSVSSITTTSAVISWSQTNASYDYLNGTTYLGLATSTTLTGLSSSTAYSGYVTVYSTTGDTATGYYSFTTAAAGVKPSAPTGLYGSDDISPHGGHFYFTASSTGTAPITYYFVVTKSTTLNGTYSTYSSSSTAGTSITVNSTGYFKCSVYASNAYGTSSTVSTSTGVQFT